MKNLKTVISVLALSAVIGMSMTACGNSGGNSDSTSSKSDTSAADSSQPEKSQSSQKSESETSEEISETAVILESNTDTKEMEFNTDSTVKAVKPYQSLEEYLKSDTAKKKIEEIKNSDAENDLPINTEIQEEEKTKLVFERTLTNELEYPEAFLKTLTSTMDSQKKTYTDLVNALQDCIEGEKLQVVVRYFDVEGNKIFERVFDEKGVVENKEQSEQSQESEAELETDNETGDDEEDFV